MSSVSWLSRARAGIARRGDRDLVPDPDAGVAGEQQVGQRVDQEVVAGQQAGDQPEAPRTSSLRSPAVRTSVSSSGDSSLQASARYSRSVSPSRRARDRLDRVLARILAGEGLDQQLGQVEHLDVAVTQRLRERVVLLLRAAHPRDAVEEQLVVVARREPLELGTRSVQQHRPQPADLTGDAVGHGRHS